MWQTTKKALSHSPYVTCFPSASAARRICYQSSPAEALGLKLRSRHCPTSPSSLYSYQSLLFFSPSFPTHSPWPVCVSRHMDVIPDERTLMHAESVSSSNAHPHQAHTLFPPIATHTYLLMCHLQGYAFMVTFQGESTL